MDQSKSKIHRHWQPEDLMRWWGPGVWIEFVPRSDDWSKMTEKEKG